MVFMAMRCFMSCQELRNPVIAEVLEEEVRIRLFLFREKRKLMLSGAGGGDSWLRHKHPILNFKKKGEREKFPLPFQDAT